jgi:hypothetical protein
VWAHFYLDSKDSSGSSKDSDSKGSDSKASGSKDHHQLIKMKLITTRVLEGNASSGGSGGSGSESTNEASYHVHDESAPGGTSGRKREGFFRIACGDGSVLGIEELQPVGKKVMKAKNFFNGLRGRRLMYAPAPPAAAPASAVAHS